MLLHLEFILKIAQGRPCLPFEEATRGRFSFIIFEPCFETSNQQQRSFEAY